MSLRYARLSQTRTRSSQTRARSQRDSPRVRLTRARLSQPGVISSLVLPRFHPHFLVTLAFWCPVKPASPSEVRQLLANDAWSVAARSTSAPADGRTRTGAG